jgi:hypothetical protein
MTALFACVWGIARMSLVTDAEPGIAANVTLGLLKMIWCGLRYALIFIQKAVFVFYPSRQKTPAGYFPAGARCRKIGDYQSSGPFFR